MTEQAQAPQPPEDPINSVPIDLKLPVGSVNLILFAVSKLPYDQAAGTIAAIRQQGDPQVTAAREALAKAAAAPPAANRNARRKTASKKA